MCEGDDYWTDECKLQVQVDYLESHPDCSESCHAAMVVSGDSGESLGVMGMGDFEVELTTREIILNWQIPTASRVIRKDCFNGYLQWDIPKAVGDYPFAIYTSTRGRVHYLPKPMSVYRYQSLGSWSSGMKSSENRLRSSKKWLEMLDGLDRVTERRWHSEFVLSASQHVAQLLACHRYLAPMPIETPFAREAARSLTVNARVKLLVKRLLWNMGFEIRQEGWGTSAGRVLVRRSADGSNIEHLFE